MSSSSFSVSSDAGVLLLRGRSSNSSPVLKASIQPFSSSALLPLGAVVHLLQVARSARRGARRRCPGGASTPRQLVKIRSMSDSCRVGTSLTASPVEPLLAGHREDPQLAGLDLALELAETREADLDLLAEQRAGQRAAAVVGHVADLAWGRCPTASASCIGKRWSGPPSDEPPPTTEAAGSFCQACDEVVDGLVRRVGRHQHALLVLDQLGQRGGVLEAVVARRRSRASRPRRARPSSSCARRPRRSSAGSSRPSRRRR